MAHDYFTIEAMIHGFHIYRDFWSTIEVSDTSREPLQTVHTRAPDKKFCRFQFSHILLMFEIGENFHHSKISHYTVTLAVRVT